MGWCARRFGIRDAHHPCGSNSVGARLNDYRLTTATTNRRRSSREYQAARGEYMKCQMVCASPSEELRLRACGQVDWHSAWWRSKISLDEPVHPGEVVMPQLPTGRCVNVAEQFVTLMRDTGSSMLVSRLAG